MSKDNFISFRELGAAYSGDELLRPLRWNCGSLLLGVLISNSPICTINYDTDHIFVQWKYTPFAILYFPWKEWCKCGVAVVVVYRRVDVKNVCQKLYKNFSLLPWINETIFWNFNWIEENYSVNIVSSVLRGATSIYEGIFVGTLPLGHVCMSYIAMYDLRL